MRPRPGQRETLYEIRFRPAGRRPPAAASTRCTSSAGSPSWVELTQGGAQPVTPPAAQRDGPGGELPRLDHLAPERSGPRPRSRRFDFMARRGHRDDRGLSMGRRAVMPAPSGPPRYADLAEAVTGGPRAVRPRRRAEAASIRVSVDKVDRVINLVGELVITQSIVAQTIANFSLDQLPRLTEAVAQMDRHARDASRADAGRPHAADQDALLPLPAAGARPHGGGGQGRRCWRRWARTRSSTRPSSSGSAIPHPPGQEMPSTTAWSGRRIACWRGKPERGVVRLEAYQQGGSIFIEVAGRRQGL